jgi:hypothetical protein
MLMGSILRLNLLFLKNKERKQTEERVSSNDTNKLRIRRALECRKTEVKTER